jgi:DNA-binding IscR family transcriptional regulator
MLVEVLRRLERGGIVIETAAGDGGGESGLFLARDSSTIGLGEILECVRGGGPGAVPSDARVAAMVGRLHQAERETLGSFTVRDLIERTSGAAAAPAPARDSERAVGDA